MDANPTSSTLPASDEVPDRIGTYEVDRVIARGAHGTVFKATDPDGLRVAIKWLAKRRDDQELETIVRLAKTVRGVPPILDRGEFQERMYFVMPYYERRSLRFRLRSLPFPQPADEVYRLAVAFTESLGELHRHDYTHFDFKPDNILIEALPSASDHADGSLLRHDERLVLTDFGATRSSGGEDWLGEGTLGYAPPELLTTIIDHDPRVDIYAASATLVECITGVAPTQARSPSDLAFTEDVLRRTGPYEPTLRRGLSFDPDRRPATISDWQAALQTAANNVADFSRGDEAPEVATRELGARAVPFQPAPLKPVPLSAAPPHTAPIRRQPPPARGRSLTARMIRGIVSVAAAVGGIAIVYSLIVPDPARPELIGQAAAPAEAREPTTTPVAVGRNRPPPSEPASEPPPEPASGPVAEPTTTTVAVGRNRPPPSEPASESPSDSPSEPPSDSPSEPVAEPTTTVTAPGSVPNSIITVAPDRIEIDPNAGAWISTWLMEDDRIELEWGPVEGADRYHLHRILARSNTQPPLSAMGPENQFLTAANLGFHTDTAVETGARYWYGIRAVNAEDATFSFHWTLAAAVTDREPPNPVGSVTATFNGEDVTVNWTRTEDNFQLASYRVYRSIDGGTPEVVDDVYSVNITVFVDLDPPSSGIVRYSVTAFDLHLNESFPTEAPVVYP